MGQFASSETLVVRLPPTHNKPRKPFSIPRKATYAQIVFLYDDLIAYKGKPNKKEASLIHSALKIVSTEDILCMCECDYQKYCAIEEMCHNVHGKHFYPPVRMTLSDIIQNHLRSLDHQADVGLNFDSDTEIERRILKGLTILYKLENINRDSNGTIRV